jgi:hypothetical protein
MRNSVGAKSPTVRFATERPLAVKARTSDATFNTSEPMRPWASVDREASVR